MLHECALCGKKRCDHMHVWCSDCANELTESLGADWVSTEWAQSYTKTIKAERYQDKKYYTGKTELCVTVKNKSGETVVLNKMDYLPYIAPGHLAETRGRVITPDDYIYSLICEGLGYKRIYAKLVEKYGSDNVASILTIKRRIKDIQARGSND